jgi:hypothetical protein
MDMSKLPKLSNSPQPAAPMSDATGAAGLRATPLSMADIIFDVGFMTIVGLILLMLGGPFGGWLIAKAKGQPYITGVTWEMGPQAGQPVQLLQLSGGMGWQYAGEWVAGVAMILAAILLLAGTALGLRRGVTLSAAGAFSAVAVIAIGLAAGAVFQAGIQPIFLLVLMLLCGVAGYSLFRHKAGGALT